MGGKVRTCDEVGAGVRAQLMCSQGSMVGAKSNSLSFRRTFVHVKSLSTFFTGFEFTLNPRFNFFCMPGDLLACSCTLLRKIHCKSQHVNYSAQRLWLILILKLCVLMDISAWTEQRPGEWKFITDGAVRQERGSFHWRGCWVRALREWGTAHRLEIYRVLWNFAALVFRPSQFSTHSFGVLEDIARNWLCGTLLCLKNHTRYWCNNDKIVLKCSSDIFLHILVQKCSVLHAETSDGASVPCGILFLNIHYFHVFGFSFSSMSVWGKREEEEMNKLE